MKKFQINSGEDFNSGFIIEANSLRGAELKVIIDLVGIHEVREFDYCTNCEEEINQVEVEEGTFGCGKCKRTDCIEIRTEIID